jgi:hypothetical protein
VTDLETFEQVERVLMELRKTGDPAQALEGRVVVLLSFGGLG